jgi:S1-C subfamily serine protease
MGLSDCSPPVPANQFHLGATCPACQETIEIGQSIVICRACSAVHHETCWHHAGGCSAYACSITSHRDPGHLSPELVITAEEAERATPPPARKGPWVAQPLERHLPPKPTRRSKLGLVACVFAVIACVLLIVGGGTHSTMPLIGGILAAMTGLVLGILSLVSISNGNQTYGGGLAAACILISSLAVVMSIFAMGRVGDRNQGQRRVRLTASRSMPSEEALRQMPASRARSMRANTVITGSSGLLSGFGVGSGIIVRQSGRDVYILTNRHVVEMGGKNPRLQILFYNGEESRAEVAWMAPDEVDLAIVKCQALTLPKDLAVQIAEKPPEQGDHVFAVGNPMALYWSYTEGVISAIRQQGFGSRDVTVYQTQTPINQGNSGGGLYNMAGELVGINTWTQDKSQAEGLSFAISAQSLVDLLKADSKADLLGSGTSGADPETEGSEQ